MIYVWLCLVVRCGLSIGYPHDICMAVCGGPLWVGMLSIGYPHDICMAVFGGPLWVKYRIST